MSSDLHPLANRLNAIGMVGAARYL